MTLCPICGLAHTQAHFVKVVEGLSSPGGGDAWSVTVQIQDERRFKLRVHLSNGVCLGLALINSCTLAQPLAAACTVLAMLAVLAHVLRVTCTLLICFATDGDRLSLTYFICRCAWKHCYIALHFIRVGK